jgi:small subunit ribosomal protein S5
MASRPGFSPRRRGPDRRSARADTGDERTVEDTVVKLYRCATVVKGGRRFSFGALVVVGDRQGQVGFGYGKANEVPMAVEKGVKLARRVMFRVPLRGTTIPHRVMGKFGASRIMLIPAAPGTGVIAGAAPRAVLQLAGVKDVLTKCYGSTSPKNLVKATVDGLKALRTRALVESLRGVALDLPPEREPAKPAVNAPAEAEPEVAAAGVFAADEGPTAGGSAPVLPPLGQESPHDA